MRRVEFLVGFFMFASLVSSLGLVTEIAEQPHSLNLDIRDSTPSQSPLISSSSVDGGASSAAQPQPQQPQARPDPVGEKWLFAGPSGIQYCQGGVVLCSGRITAIAPDPSDSTGNTIYIGGAAGGVWKTTDRGSNWTPLLDNPLKPDGTPLTQYSIAIGSIAVDSSGTVYVGTGEGNNGFDSYYGAGILKSTDGGNSWVQLGASTFGKSAFTKIVVNGNTVIASTTGGFATSSTAASSVVSPGAPLGVYLSTDGGASWTRTLSASSIASDLVMDPTNPSIVYAAVDSALSKSTDGGSTWTPLYGPAFLGRINLAISASSPTTVLAVGGDITNNATLWMTTNGGNSWVQITTPVKFCVAPAMSQCFYDLVVAVDPIDPNTVYLGGLDLYRTTNANSPCATGGGLCPKWTDLGGGGSFNKYIHADQHAFAFNPTDHNTIYSGNDGGIWTAVVGVNCSGGPLSNLCWTNLNRGLGLTQFQFLASHPTDLNTYFGGTQDNGSPERLGTSTIWSQLKGGDGGWAAFDTNTPTTIYRTFGGVTPQRSDDGGSSWFPIKSGLNKTDPSFFYVPMAMDRTSPTTLYLGTFRLWKTTDRGDNWSTPSPGLSLLGSLISALAVAPSNGQTVYVGTSTGTFFVSTDGGQNFALRIFGLPDRQITKIAVDPTNAQKVLVTFTGFGGPHVFASADAGANWRDISSNLPDFPVDSIAVDSAGNVRNPGAIYVGTDIGVFVSLDEGTNWETMGTGLPRVPVFDLVFSAGNVALLAATHGRGVWTISHLPFHPLTYVATSTEALGLPGASIEADCYPGDFATGGGFSSRPLNPQIPLSSEPNVPNGKEPTGWTASFSGPIFIDPDNQAKVFAVCMTPATVGGSTTSTSIVEADTTCLYTPSCVEVDVTAHCGGSDFATGGGFETVALSLVLSSKPTVVSGTPAGWSAFAFGVLFAGTVKAFVVCMAPITNLGGITSTSVIASTMSFVSNGGVSVSCGFGDFATGGGFDQPILSNQLAFRSEPNIASGTPIANGALGWSASFSQIFGGTLTTLAICMNPYPFNLFLGLSPTTAANALGKSQTVTAALTDTTGAPISGGIVTFTVVGANSASGFGMTDAAGQATFTYAGNILGTDSITVQVFAEGKEVTAIASVIWFRLNISGVCSSSVSTDSSGNTIITSYDCNGNILAQVKLPPGTSFPTGSVNGTYSTSLLRTMFQVTGVSVPYPPGKSILLSANPNANSVCIVDSPSFSISTGIPPSCNSSDTLLSQAVLRCDGSIVKFSGFPDSPTDRTYVCTAVITDGQSFLKVDGLAFSFVETMITRVKVTTFFTDVGSNPLATDTLGNPKVDVVIVGGKVRSTNPGQILSWANVTNTGSVPLQSLTLTETFPVDWVVSPSFAPAAGAVSVFFVFPNGARVDITSQTSVTATTGNPETLTFSIANITSTAAGRTLLPGYSILTSVKLGYGLKGTSQAVTSYPRNYLNLVTASAWTSTIFTGLQPSGTASMFFRAYAKPT